MQLSNIARLPAAVDIAITHYQLEGDVTICDKTNGIAKAVFVPHWSTHQQAIYQVFVGGRKLIYPTCSHPYTSECVKFIGSKSLAFKQKDEWIKITEINNEKKKTFYVDTQKEVEGIAYDVYSYLPTEITREEAYNKIRDVRNDFPLLLPEAAVFNRHGVAVFGWDQKEKQYILLWANPQEDKVKKMMCIERGGFFNYKPSYAKSEDGQINFRYLYTTKSYYLNAEAATTLDLPI